MGGGGARLPAQLLQFRAQVLCFRGAGPGLRRGAGGPGAGRGAAGPGAAMVQPLVKRKVVKKKANRFPRHQSDRKASVKVRAPARRGCVGGGPELRAGAASAAECPGTRSALAWSVLVRISARAGRPALAIVVLSGLSVCSTILKGQPHPGLAFGSRLDCACLAGGLV